nr:MAG TPA: hypothetical protein [Caudoviricetes sp.]
MPLPGVCFSFVYLKGGDYCGRKRQVCKVASSG